MSEKEIAKNSWILLLVIPFLVTLAQSLSTFSSQKCERINWRDFVIQLIVGTISGLLFGLLGCWITAGNESAVGAISGFGAVLGIHGVQRVASVMEKWTISKFDK